MRTGQEVGDEPAGGTITDVDDLNEVEEEKLEFPNFTSTVKFIEFSEHFLQEANTTASGAQQWEAFYRKGMQGIRDNPKPANPKNHKVALEALDHLMELYNAKVGPREPGQEG